MKKLIVPTGTNVVCVINEALLANRRKGFDGPVRLPSLRKLAKLVTKESSLLLVDMVSPTVPDDFTR